MKLLLRALGIALIIFGTMFALQGLGILMWPPQSLMLANRDWALYGSLMATLGALLIWFAGRLPRRG
ncbi:MAG: hypothetical protein AAFR88_04010 [Pseudomonadota bacterium]